MSMSPTCPYDYDVEDAKEDHCHGHRRADAGVVVVGVVVVIKKLRRKRDIKVEASLLGDEVGEGGGVSTEHVREDPRVVGLVQHEGPGVPLLVHGGAHGVASHQHD